MAVTRGMRYLRGLARAAGSRGVILEPASADLVCLLSPVAIGE